VAVNDVGHLVMTAATIAFVLHKSDGLLHFIRHPDDGRYPELRDAGGTPDSSALRS
jgi:hypothetical protein